MPRKRQRLLVPPDPRYRFFGGKGGAGKTTCSAAAALAAAESGKRVLVVSTDPAHSLGDALGARLGPSPRLLGARRGRLYAAELDADRALVRWLDRRRELLRSIAERGTYLDREDVERFLRLSFPGVDELVGLLELDRLAEGRAYDEVVVDTAPTGHTLRLLATPDALRRIAAVLDGMQAKHRYLSMSLRGAYAPGAEDALIADIERQGQRLAGRLRDTQRSSFTWVTLPERLSVEETLDGIRELAASGIAVGELVVNRMAPPPDPGCSLCRARARAEAAVLTKLRASSARRVLRVVPDLGGEPRSRAGLRRVAAFLARTSLSKGALRRAPLDPRALRRSEFASARRLSPSSTDDADWLTAIVPPGTRLVVFGGKGGVGKTTCAATTALALAERQPGRRVLLLSVDPAHSLGDVLGTQLGDEQRGVPGAPRGLRARELDAARGFRIKRERYRDSIAELFDRLRGRSRFQVAFDRAVLQDLIDLAPPGLDEIFGIVGLTDALMPGGPGHAAGYDVVVLDTAPTGHALRLLALPAAALEWVHALLATLLKYREAVGLGALASDLVEIAGRLRRLQALLHDPRQTRFVVVTRAAELPWLEAERLQAGLSRLGIAVSALIVNAMTPPSCRRCARIAAAERRVLERVSRKRTRGAAAPLLFVTPATAPPPMGVSALRRWGPTWERIRTDVRHRSRPRTRRTG